MVLRVIVYRESALQLEVLLYIRVHLWYSDAIHRKKLESLN